MSLISMFKEEVKKQKKAHLGEESRTPLAFPTGLDLLDFKNGKLVIPGGEHKKYLSTGVTEGSYVMWIGASGSGKAQPLYSKVYTPNGPVKMGNLKIGDSVLTPDGGTANIIGIYPQGKIDNYRVTLTDGTTMECNSEHLFKVSYRARLKKTTKSYHKYAVKSLEEIMKDYKGKDNKLKYYIPLLDSVSFEEKEVSVDPYLLGALIGDGTFRGHIGFSNSESDVVENVRLLVEADGLILNKDNGKKDIDYTIVKPKDSKIQENSLATRIREYGLYNLKSQDKFIPDVYKYNTEQIRLSILQGLIDTNGSVEKKNCVYFYTVSERLANDVVEIVQSLGGIARKGKKETFYTKKGKAGRKQTLDCYRIYIHLPSKYTPYTSTKHKEAYKGRTKYIEPIRKIKDIELIGSEEMQCIMIDSEDHLYLTDNFITTHNTTVALQSAFNIIRPYEQGTIFHFDLENATDKTRVAKVSNQPMDYINEHYFHKNTGISSESFYESIYMIHSLKTGDSRSKFEVNTGKYDERGDEIVILAPTVIILDSLPLLVPQKITEEEELSGYNVSLLY